MLDIETPFNKYTVTVAKARFIRRISVASNAIQTIDDETACLIVYCLNCIRRDGNQYICFKINVFRNVY